MTLALTVSPSTSILAWWSRRNEQQKSENGTRRRSPRKGLGEKRSFCLFSKVSGKPTGRWERHFLSRGQNLTILPGCSVVGIISELIGSLAPVVPQSRAPHRQR